MEQHRPDVARRRRRWIAWQGRFDPERLVFIDETWVKTNMAPLRGWGPRGERVIAHAPHARWRTMTFVGALRHDRLEAPCVFDGPINGRCFLAYVEQFLIPTLRPGDIVIADNLGSHKGRAVRQAIRQSGARLWFLPPYSPELNPIEMCFSKIKHWMREAQSRSMDEILQNLGRITQTVQPNEAAHYFQAAGYASIKT